MQGVTNTLACLCLVALAVSCGGSTGWTSDEVETAVRVSVEEKIAELAPGGTLDAIDCVKRDGNEFSCLAEVTADGESATLAASVTCEEDCLWVVDQWTLKP